MRKLLRPLAILSLVLLVPALPFLGFGDRLDQMVEGWLDPPPPPSAIALMTVALLSSDILLPIPSSLVSTFAGSQLGILAATAAILAGDDAGARCWGSSWPEFGAEPWPFDSRRSTILQRIDRLGQDYGVWMLIATRPLPLLAEAAVLLAGLSGIELALVLDVRDAEQLGHCAGVFDPRPTGQCPRPIAAGLGWPRLHFPCWPRQLHVDGFANDRRNRRPNFLNATRLASHVRFSRSRCSQDSRVRRSPTVRREDARSGADRLAAAVRRDAARLAQRRSVRPVAECRHGLGAAGDGRAAVLVAQHAGGHPRRRRHADRPGLSHRPLGSRPAGASRRRGCSSRPARCRLPPIVPIRATAARRARSACSTACPIATTRRLFFAA